MSNALNFFRKDRVATTAPETPAPSEKPREQSEGSRRMLIRYADVVGVDRDGVLILSDPTELLDEAAPMGLTPQQVLQEAVDAEYAAGGKPSLRVILEVEQ